MGLGASKNLGPDEITYWIQSWSYESCIKRNSKSFPWDNNKIFANIDGVPSNKKLLFYLLILITQPVRTLFLFKSIWTRPQGSQGCQKIHKNMLQIKLLSSCAKIAPKRHKLRKLSKLIKKCQKNPVFLDFFENSSIWGPKPHMVCLVDPSASFDTTGASI